MRFGPVRLLILLILLLGGGLAWLWVDQQGHWRNVVWAAPKALPPDLKVPTSPLQTEASTGNAAQFAAILERPVFAPDRRPPPPPAPPAPPPPPDPMANIRVSGIFSGDNAGILARVEGKIRRIKVNETIGSWTLKSIDGRDVTFSQGDENRTLRLAYSALGPPPPPPTPPSGDASALPPGSPAAGTAGAAMNVQDQTRETMRRRNALRAAKGLPPITE